ncbi:GAF domain-containing protein [Aeromonas sobria]|uniref:GAF domain-containing protein n=1 Tax=Aeromonas sobria TaxID=646 RepID=UPI001F00D8F3|nr:GAF domain-containing protein [Aeromonas sobria]
MIAPPIPVDEESRLARLRILGLLDREPIDHLDRLTRLISRHFDLPVALVSLTDTDRQWFLARTGIALCEIGRDISFCGHAILQPDIMQVPDARLDPRFTDNPLVIGPPPRGLLRWPPPAGAGWGSARHSLSGGQQATPAGRDPVSGSR